MVFGAVVDSACLVLQGGGECSKRKGACLLYDSNKFKNYMHGFVVAIRVSVYIVLVTLIKMVLNGRLFVTTLGHRNYIIQMTYILV